MYAIIIYIYIRSSQSAAVKKLYLKKNVLPKLSIVSPPTSCHDEDSLIGARFFCKEFPSHPCTLEVQVDYF